MKQRIAVSLILAIVVLLVRGGSAAPPTTIRLSDAQAEKIGRRLWQNESGGTVAGLTAWNAGENFASLGIGHFIWYPAGRKGPFEESFPELLNYMITRGISLPDWLRAADACPWPNRAVFLADSDSEHMRQLRALLEDTIAVQAKFAANRLERALPKMLAAAPAEDREKIRQNFYRVATEPQGMYALVDYVNFKGEGTLTSERYRGQGWGLMQVLTAMGTGPALIEFSQAADAVLTRRVENSPPERGEQRWLSGWRSRVRTYQGGEQ
jgi:hypothetical protein